MAALDDVAPSARPPGRQVPREHGVRRHVPGLALVAACAGLAFALHAAVPAVPPLVAAVLLGGVAANTGHLPAAARPGTRFAATRLLRLGVVLLGFQLSFTQILALGASGLGVVIGVVVLTLVGTRWIGRRLGASEGLSLLVATGFAICGASAIAAMESVTDASEEDTAYAIMLVTLCGTLAIVVLPLAAPLLGLTGPAFGAWVGASVHDVAQVVATAAPGGREALESAVVVKLTRVVMLAPIIAVVVGLRRRRERTPDRDAGERRPPVVPLFVAAFLGAVLVRSLGILPAASLHALEALETIALAAALAGLGTGVQLHRLRRIGARPLLLGLAAWFVVASASYAGVIAIA